MLKHAYQIGIALAVKEAGARLDSFKSLLAKHPRLTEVLGGGALGTAAGGSIGYAAAPERGLADSMLLGALTGAGAGLGSAAAGATGAQGSLPTTVGGFSGYGVYRLIQKLQGQDGS